MTPRQPDVVCISSIDWDFIWQGHQEIMSRLAAGGSRVLFVENTGVRAPKVRDLGRIRQRIRNWWQSTKGFREERPNLFVYSPLVLPLPYSRFARWINRRVLFGALRRWLRATGFYRPIVWTFLPTPLALDLITELDPQLTIYYCIDDLASSSPAARRIVPSEQQLFRTADLVFVTSERLRQRAAQFRDEVHLFPFGVNIERFEQAREATVPQPPELASVARPIVGYVGGLHQWVDQQLVASVAERLPEATFAFVGPAQTDLSTLERCANVKLLGQREHADLPKYVKQFDVGIVPYRQTEYTANVYPTKLNEYLAMGLPVVATDLPEIRRFNDMHAGVVQIAKDSDAFAAAIRASLNDSSPADVARRIEVAAENSWQRRVAAMTALMTEAVARRDQDKTRWDERLRRVYRAARSRVAVTALVITALYLLIFESNAVWWAAAPPQVAAPAERADAIVVFAGGVGESGQAGGGAQERLARAVGLYREGDAPTLVLSSGFVYSFRDAQVMRAFAVDQGVPAAAIVLEERSTNTYDMVRFVNDLLRERGARSILLISSPYHMRRALLVWHKVAPDLHVVPTPPDRSQFYDHTRGATLEQIRGIAQEYAAIVVYWFRGWL